jgi:manganese transport protein
MSVALRLLFGLPIVAGICATLVSLPLIALLERRGTGRLETFVVALMIVVACCLGVEIFLSQPDWSRVASGLVPSAAIFADPAALYLAVGILGATVMPHNLYLHSAIIRSRVQARTEMAKREIVRLSTADSAIALTLAMFVNAAILIVAAATFHAAGRTDVVEIGAAYHLLTPMLGTGAASLLFGIALLASGQNSTITGALAGQVVMEGFTNLQLAPWMRRTITRAIAIVPAALVAVIFGEAGTARLLVLSQVVLSLQLPFAVVPLVRLTSDRSRMGNLVNPLWLRGTAYAITTTIIALNATLLVQLAGS